MKRLDSFLRDRGSYLLWLICLLVIFVSDDTITFGTNKNEVFVLVKYVVCILLFVVLLLIKPSSFRKDDRLLRVVYVLFCLLIVNTIIFNGGFSFGYLYQILLISISFLLVSKFSRDVILYYYVKIIYYIAFLSLVGTSIYFLAPIVIESLPITYSQGGTPFYNAFVYSTIGYMEVYRNSGIFREPGVFMIYLNIALIIKLLYFRTYNKRYLVVFILSLGLTLSTGGFLIFLLVLLAVYYENAKKLSASVKVFTLVASLSLIFLSFTNSFIFDNVFEKIVGSSINEGSGLARQASVFANLGVFIDNIFVGTGIQNYESAFQGKAYDLYGIKLEIGHNTNTITTFFAIYGVFLGLLVVYLIYRLSEIFSNKKIVTVWVFLAFVAMLSNEDLRFSLMFYILMFLGIKKEEKII